MTGLTKEQHAARRFGVGASEVGAILGVDHYAAALDVYSEKVGLVEPRQDTQHLRMGRRIEGVLLDEYGYEMGCEVRTGLGTLSHKLNPWALCTPDALVPSLEAARSVWERGVEAKQRHWRNRDGWGDAGSEQVPAPVWAQCAWSMGVVDLDRWDVVAFLGGEYRVYHIHRDRDLEGQLFERVRDFWENNVQKRRPPDLLDNPEAGRRYLGRIFPREMTTDLLDATPEQCMLLTEYSALKVLGRDATRKAEVIEVQLLAAIGEHTGIRAKDGLYMTWKEVKEGRVDAYTRASYRRAYLGNFTPKGKRNK